MQDQKVGYWQDHELLHGIVNLAIKSGLNETQWCLTPKNGLWNKLHPVYGNIYRIMVALDGIN